MSTLSETEIVKAAELMAPWYHEIQLTKDYKTPSNMKPSIPLWDNVRKVRKFIEYKGKTVLDIGSMDGMWAFEAEQLGGTVTASDIWQKNRSGRRRLELAREALNSKIELFAGLNVHTLVSQLMGEKFDIIQCLGVLYHIQNPMLGLNNIAATLNCGGVVLIETAIWPEEPETPVARFNSDNGIYCDPTTYWAPNWECFLAMMDRAGLRCRKETLSIVPWKINRVCFVAERTTKDLDPNLGLA